MKKKRKGKKVSTVTEPFGLKTVDKYGPNI